jgi:hypothetical protein
MKIISNNLHSTLKHMLAEKVIAHDYIDDQHASDEIEGFNVDDPVVCEEEVSNHEAGLVDMDTQIEAVESDMDSEESDFEKEPDLVSDSDSELDEEEEEEDADDENHENHEVATVSVGAASAAASVHQLVDQQLD